MMTEQNFHSSLLLLQFMRVEMRACASVSRAGVKLRSGRIRSVGARAEDGRVLTAKTETNCGHLFDPEPSEERFMFSDLKSGAKRIPDSRGSDRREK